MPDTSPRNDDSVTVPNVDSYDLGIGAGFYVNTTEEPYSKHYQMYSYITEELPALLEKEFKIGMFGLRSISGQ
jgi:S-formylglutathione hydrolase